MGVISTRRVRTRGYVYVPKREPSLVEMKVGEGQHFLPPLISVGIGELPLVEPLVLCIFGASAVVCWRGVGLVRQKIRNATAPEITPKLEDLSFFFLCVSVQVQRSAGTPTCTGFVMGGHYIHISRTRMLMVK